MPEGAAFLPDQFIKPAAPAILQNFIFWFAGGLFFFIEIK